MQRAWLLVLVLAGCGGGSKQAVTPPPPPPAPEHTCAKSADHMIDVLPANAKSAPPEQLKALKDDIVSHCTNDKWSPEVMACVEGATKTDDIAKCDDLLTPAQRDALAKDSDAGSAPGGGPAPAAAPSPVQAAPPPPDKAKGGSRGPKKGGDPQEGGE
jgi:hypothetical protein